MASQQQARKQQQAGKGHEEAGQGQAMNLEEIGKYRAEAQQRSADTIRAAEERFNKASNQQARSGGAHGTVTVTQETAKRGESHGRGSHSSEAQQWLADAAADARERCNKALGTSPAAAHGGKASAGAAPHQQTRNEKEGGQARGHLTRQDEMGKHGTEGQKNSTAEAARAAVEKHDDKGRETGATAGQGVKNTAARAASATAEKTQEAMGTAADYTMQAAAKVKDVTAGAAGTTMEYVKQAAVKASKAKDSASQTASKAKDSASKTADKARDMTGQHKDRATDTAGEIARKAADTAVQAKEKVKDTAVSMFQKAGDTAGHAKEMAKDAAAAMAQRSRDTAAQAGDKAKDTTWRAEQKAEVKKSASGTGKTGGGGATTTKAKGGDDEDTTVRGDVLEAVGATVVGLAQHAKGIVAGEEELVPVEGEKGKATRGAKEEKRKLA